MQILSAKCKVQNANIKCKVQNAKCKIIEDFRFGEILHIKKVCLARAEIPLRALPMVGFDYVDNT